ncbi:Uncharacterised protein [Vibrio cholerae]|nr:Uncharacterised protein [Vibrio cholerae]
MLKLSQLTRERHISNGFTHFIEIVILLTFHAIQTLSQGF